VVITNTKDRDPLRARVTFNEEPGKPPEVWELTLTDPGTEVALDLLARYARETPFNLNNDREGPLCMLLLVVLKGQATIKIDRQTLRPPADVPSQLLWDNKGPGVKGPVPIDPKVLQYWNKAFANTPEAAETRRELDNLLLLPGNKPIEVLLEESLTRDRPSARRLAVYGLGALDNLSKLLDVLADQEEQSAGMRDAAIVSLRHWIARRSDHDKILYEYLLNSKRFKEREAITTMQLLHDPQEEQLKGPEGWSFLIFCIKDKKPIIRELAYWHLIRLIPGTGQNRARFYPGGGDSDKPERAYQEWKKLVPEGTIPKGPPMK
jgi:hypothetical protein